ncbi:uncharacterized protein RCC_12012 [Ramularia collo-cygni]|uniref:Wax synthase domain-containing protein n=1 Tax=Ramularia collo-cygni TaxID=112498 RepID=A0A2D3V213_9PEZI|nr:uncharacterized protein RCC_12012 [Ramularia collo-cygni]CZT16514.1 uncharacterized protein RCC_12012 [Ramularia collo-cygni]
MAFEIPTTLVSLDLRAPLYMALQTIIAATLICSTPRDSILRVASLPLFIYLMLQSWEAAAAFTGQGVLYSFWWVGPYANIFHCMNNMVLHPLDSDDIHLEMRKWEKKPLKPAGASLLNRIIFTTATLFSYRGINTTWQIGYVPEFPGNVIPTRARFLFRQCWMIALQYLIMDVLASSPPPADVVESWANGKEWLWLSLNPHRVTTGDLFNRLVGCTMNWFIVGRVMNDIWYRVFSVIFVGLGLSQPKQWPPLYGNYADTFTLRRYFGRFWHQTVRWPFLGVATYISRRVLGMTKGVADQHTRNFIVFFLSGTLHSILYVAFGGSWNPAAGLISFCSFPLGIMFEDAVQSVWRRSMGRSDSNKVWFMERAVGHVWVVIFLSLVSPIFNYPLQRIEGNPTYLVPWSVVHNIKEFI